ncbi:MAG TPA: hypothetical protein VK656_02810, partial [Candidatus Acidoferrum sp.]|nr:hypothetical protein [Candidatus Acidoferrum sp.]
DGQADPGAVRMFREMPTVQIEAAHDVMITNPVLIAETITDLLAEMRGSIHDRQGPPRSEAIPLGRIGDDNAAVE